MGNNIGRLEIQIPKELEIQLFTFNTHKVLSLSRHPNNQHTSVFNIPIHFDINIIGPIKKRLLTISPNIKSSQSLNGDMAALWGTLNSLIQRMIIGQTQGFTQRLGLKGVGYRLERESAENSFILYIGLTHPKRISIPLSIQCKLLKNNTILEGKCDNWQELTNALNKIRLIKPAIKDKYSGKGFFIIN